MQLNTKFGFEIIKNIRSEGVNSSLYLVRDLQVGSNFILKKVDKKLLKQVQSYKGKNKKLETACAYYNIENKNAHRADSDTLATAKLFLIIKDNI